MDRTITPVSAGPSSTRRKVRCEWYCLFVVVLTLLGLGLHLGSLDLSPAVWIDEVMILDYGRVLRYPDTEWSVTLAPNGLPAVPLSPLYCLAAWLWAEAGDGTILWVRLFPLITSLLLFIVFFAFVRRIGIPLDQALLLSFALWADIVIVGSFRGARADVAAISLVFAGGVLASKALASGSLRLAFVCGVALALSVLTWPTAVATMPIFLVLLEKPADIRRVAAISLSALVGAGLVVLSWYAYYSFQGFWDRLYTGPLSYAGARFVSPWEIGKTVAVLYRFTPWIFLWFALGLFVQLVRKNFLLLISVLMSLAIMMCVPPFYRWRVVYLSPLLYIVAAKAFEQFSWHRYVLLVFCLLGLTVTVGGRFVSAMIEYSGRNYAAFESALVPLVPNGSTVVSDDYTPYYVALNHGWKFYVGSQRDSEMPGKLYLLAGRRGTAERWAQKYELEHLGVARTEGKQLRAQWRSSYCVDVYRVLGPRSGCIKVNERQQP